MGILRHLTDGAQYPLHQYHRIGREQADLTLPHQLSVSRIHASLRWTGKAWELKDQASTNGTKVNGDPLLAGMSVRLSPQDIITFGLESDPWQLLDPGPPTAAAISGDTVRSAHDDTLALPDDDRPLATIYQTDVGWILEQDEQQTPLSHGQTVTIEGQSWQIFLPRIEPNTGVTTTLADTLENIVLRFTTTKDDRVVGLTVQTSTGLHELGFLSHHRLLLYLARARLKDHALSLAAQGWVSTEDAHRALNIDAGHRGVMIFNARKQFAALKIENSANIVQGRPRQLRLGASQIVIESA